MSDWDFETRAIHGGASRSGKEWGATNVPIYQSASFAYETAEELEDVFAGRRYGHLYSRITNPTVTAFELRLRELEQGVGAVATSSGMAAIHTLALALAGSGDEILASSSLFGGTLHLFSEVLARCGVVTRYFDPARPESLREALSDRTRFVFAETIGNPKIDVPDIRALAAVTAEKDLPLVVDATLTTPYLLRARELGAAVVTHSTTKYITGNGSTIGGALVDLGTYDWRLHPDPGIQKAAKQVGAQFAFLATVRRQILQNTGACQAPFDAYMHLLGLETLGLRMERHCANALALARYLEDRPEVLEVRYPGLASSPFHAVATEQFGARYGALLTIRLGSRERCFELVRRLKLVKNLANLGDAKTLVIHPASTIYRDNSPAEREAAGVSEDLLRVSVGIESPKDIINDFDSALKETKDGTG